MTRPTVYSQVAFESKPSAIPIWTDTSTYHREIHTQRGRQRELDRDEAGTASVTYKNSDRRFDPNHASGPYAPNVKSMKRLRIGASDPDGSTPYLSLQGGIARMEAPSAVGITGDIDIRIYLAMDDWTPAESQILATKWTYGNPSQVEGDWGLYITSTGKLRFSWSEDGSGPFTSGGEDTPPGVSNGDPIWLRVTLDVDNGAGGFDVEYFTSADGISWSSFFTNTGGATTSIADTATHVLIGDGLDAITGSPERLTGIVYAFQVLDGIDGDLVIDVDFEDPDVWWRGDRMGSDALDNGWELIGDAADDAEIPAGRYYLFNGFVLGWPQKYPLKRNGIATPDAVDGFHVLNLAKLTFSAIEQSTDARVGETLDEAGWSEVERRIGSGQTTAVAEEVEETPALEHLLRIADSENGRVFIDKTGSLVFRGRHETITGDYIVSQATFGDSGSEHRYLTVEMNPGEALIFNEVKVSRMGGSGYQTASDPDSIEDFFRRTKTKSNLSFGSDTEALSAARWLLSFYKDERQRIEKMVVDAEAKPNVPATLWPILLGLELGDRVTVRRRPQNVGSVIEQESIIEGIEHDIGPENWRVTFALSPANNTDFGILDDAVFGLLDETMKLVY